MPLVLEACVRGEDAPVAELAESVGMKSPNYVASALGRAVGGGLGMWKSGTAIRACQENVALAIRFLKKESDTSDPYEFVAAKLGMKPVDVRGAIDQLPVASKEVAA